MTPSNGSQNQRMNLRVVLPIVIVVIALVAAAIYYFLNRGTTGMDKPETRQEQMQAAEDALSILQGLAVENYELLGFASPEEAQTAQLGTALKVFFIPLDGLQEYTSVDHPRDLLTDTGLVLYSVEVDGEVRSSIQVQGEETGWTPVGFGSATLIRAIAALDIRNDAFIVQVPTLGLYFLGLEEDGNLTLRSVYDVPQFEFRAGQSLEAARVLELIQPLAREIDPNAPT